MILVTGAAGFIGSALLARAAQDRTLRVRGAVRGTGQLSIGGVETVAVDDLAPSTDWTRVVSGVDVVVHLAARVHVMRERVPDPVAEFHRVNVSGTLNLARQAASAGVQRFIFLSSVKVNGESTVPGGAFRADDTPAPADDYGRSKHEAEQQLRQLAAQTGLEIVIIRPVLVYGPGVKANFHALMRWLYRGIPLPLGAIHNRRSLVALDNLVDLIVRCLHHPAAPNQTFLVSDGEDLSTPALLRRTGAAMGRPARLVAVPAPMVLAAARALRLGDFAQRLCGSLQVDIAKTRECLGWVPPVSVDDALRKTVDHFLAQVRHREVPRP